MRKHEVLHQTIGTGIDDKTKYVRRRTKEVKLKKSAAGIRQLALSCPACSMSFRTQAGLARHKCGQLAAAGGPGRLAATGGPGQLAGAGGPIQLAGAGGPGQRSGQPVILCLPDHEGSAQLCYAAYIGKMDCCMKKKQ